MLRSALCLVCFVALALAGVLPARAAVELALDGQPPVLLEEVYLRDGVSFLAVEDVLPVLALDGRWDSVAHVYRLQTPRGTALISPGSNYLRLGERFIPLSKPPRFIDGRLRLPEDFVLSQLPYLIGQPVYYRNLNPRQQEIHDPDETALDRLFAFILRKKKPAGSGPLLRAVAIDPGHGGQDPGALGPGGAAEKNVTLQVGRHLEKLLKMRLGIPVFLSRDNDYALSLKQRHEAAAHPDVDAFILLHAQASLSPHLRGITLFVRPQEESAGESLPAGADDSLLLARHLRDQLRQEGFQVTGIIQAPILFLGRGDLPTVLVELGYLSNGEERALLQDTQHQERLAVALYQGLQQFATASKEARR